MKISIITVAYNSASTITDTFDSVLSQTYKDIEYIVVDGASKDSTVDLIRAYEPRFEGRMKWVSEPDKGLYDAMNKGIDMATGDVVGILNSDDLFSSVDVVEKISQELSTNPSIDCIYGDVHFVNPNDLLKVIRYYSSKKFRPEKFRFGFMPAHPSCYIKKKCFEKYGLYKMGYKIAADYELLIRFLYKNKINTKYVSLDIVKMRVGGVSTESLKSRYILNKEIVKACKENGIYTNILILSFKYFIKIFELKR